MREQEAALWTKWRELIFEQTKSGQSGAKFCRERDLRVWQFYDWKKRLGEAEGEKFVSVEVKPSELVAPHSGSGDKAIEVRLRSGRSLVVEPGFDVGHLRTLLAVLEKEG